MQAAEHVIATGGGVVLCPENRDLMCHVRARGLARPPTSHTLGPHHRRRRHRRSPPGPGRRRPDRGGRCPRGGEREQQHVMTRGHPGTRAEPGMCEIVAWLRASSPLAPASGERGWARGGRTIAMSAQLVEIDGSFGEGGGQNPAQHSLALSLLTGKPFHLRHVRAAPQAGLAAAAPQSVAAAAAVGAGPHARRLGGSTDLTFEPGAVTAGALPLRHRHRRLPPASSAHALPAPGPARRPAQRAHRSIGGTHVSTSPCLSLPRRNLAQLPRTDGPAAVGLRHAPTRLRPARRRRRRAHSSQPCHGLQGMTLPARRPVTVRGFTAAAGLPLSLLERQARRAAFRLKQRHLRVEIDEEGWEGGPGTALVRWSRRARRRPPFFGPGCPRQAGRGGRG